MEHELVYDFFRKFGTGVFEFKEVSKAEDIKTNISGSEELPDWEITGKNYYDMDGEVISEEILYVFGKPVLFGNVQWFVLVKKA